MYIHKVMKKKIDIARSSAERDLTISTTKQIEALWNGQEREDREVEIRWTPAHIKRGGLLWLLASAFALPPNILDVFSRPAQMLCSSVWHGLSGFRQPTMVGSAPVRCTPRTSQGQYPIILLLYEVLLLLFLSLIHI